MAAPTECGNCVPTFTLKNLRIKDIDPDHGITFHKLIIEYVVCLKDIKCIPRSTKLPDPKIRLPAFKDGVIDPMNVTFQLPPVTILLNMFKPLPVQAYGYTFTHPDVCCKKDRPINCCGEMKKALCDCIKRKYSDPNVGALTPEWMPTPPTEEQVAECCFSSQFEVWVQLPPNITDDTSDMFWTTLSFYLEQLKEGRTAKEKIIKALKEDLGMGAYGLKALMGACGYTSLDHGNYFSPHPEDPIYGGWESLCTCIGKRNDKCP